MYKVKRLKRDKKISQREITVQEPFLMQQSRLHVYSCSIKATQGDLREKERDIDPVTATSTP